MPWRARRRRAGGRRPRHPAAGGRRRRGGPAGGVGGCQHAGPPDPGSSGRTGGRRGGSPAEVRPAGKGVGRGETPLEATGIPIKSRLVVPSVPAKLNLTFLSTARATF